MLPLALWVATRVFGRGGWAPLVATVACFYVVGLVARGVEFTFSPETAKEEPRFWTVLAYLDLFGAGMLVALLKPLWGVRLRDSPRARWGLIAAGLAIYLAANAWSAAVAPENWQRGVTLEYTLGFSLVLCFGIALGMMSIVSWPEGRVPVLTWKPLVWVGTISYSIYLYHIGVQFALMILSNRLGWNFLQIGMVAFGLIALVPTLAVSATMFYLVEQPAMRWGAKYSFHKAASTVTSG